MALPTAKGRWTRNPFARLRFDAALRNLLIAAIAASATYAAWLSDDYLIGLRQVVNLVRGEGFSFNTDVRVQTMTSPLWGLLLVPVYAASDGWYGPIALSLLLSVGAVIGFTRCFWREESARRPVLGALCLLLMSKSFMDFTTSGLENPLAYALLALFCCTLVRTSEAANRERFVALSGLAGLLVLARYDYVLMAAPGLGWAALRVRSVRALAQAAATFLGVVLPWLLFSLFYYGTFLSNSYYAKVTTQIPRADLIKFGLQYWHGMFLHDPVTLLVLAGGAALTFRRDAPPVTRAIMLGVVAYSAYVTLIGGDFMLGRFLSAATLAAAFAIVLSLRDGSALGARRLVLAASGAVALLGPQAPALYTFFSHEELQRAGARIEVLPRLADEKNAYVGERGLLTGWRRFEPWLRERLTEKGSSSSRVIAVDCGGLGWRAFKFGLDAHVFDRCALADPFLSKLPLYEIGRDRVLLGWGPGHYSRSIPPGYADTLFARQNLIADPVLASTFDDVKVITTGPLFTVERWRAIARLVTGVTVRRAATAPAYAGVSAQGVQRPNVVPYSEFERLYFTDCMWEYSNRVLEPGRALSIRLAEALAGGTVNFSAQPDVLYRFQFYARGRSVGYQDVRLGQACPGTSLAEIDLVLQPGASRSFDRMDIISLRTNGLAGIGGLYFGKKLRGPPIEPIRYRAADLPASTGSVLDGGARSAVVGRDAIGHIVFGPYVHFAAGTYEVTIDYEGARPLGASNGGWDVTLWQGKLESRLAGGSVLGTGGTRSKLTSAIVVPASSPDSVLEIRVFFDGSGNLTVHNVVIEERD